MWLRRIFPGVISLSDDDFALLGVPMRFEIDLKALDLRWKELSRQIHPDRHLLQGHTAQRLSMQWTIRINEAHQRLRDPIRRAAYLCQLRGVPVQAESNTTMPAEFLMQQMQWREQLDESQSLSEIETLQNEVNAERAQLQNQLAQMLDGAQANPKAASELVRALMFIERFGETVADRLESLRI